MRLAATTILHIQMPVLSEGKGTSVLLSETCVVECLRFHINGSFKYEASLLLIGRTHS